MSNLANQIISQSYVSVLNIGTTSGATLTANPQVITDGDGNASPLQLSTTGITVSGPIIPTTSGSFDLGSPTKPFRHLYVSSGSVYLDNNQVLTLQGDSTTLISPQQNTIRFINDVLFDSENSGSNVGGQFTMLGVGPNVATNTLYSGDFHFLNTNGYLLMSNKIPGMAAGSGSINILAEDTGSINIYTDVLPLNIMTDDGVIGLTVSGSGNIITTINGNNQNSLTTTLVSSSVNFSQNATQEAYVYNSEVANSETNLISVNETQFVLGAVDITGNTYAQKLRVYVLPGQTDLQDYNTSTSGYTSWMHIDNNSGNNPIPKFDRGIISLSGISVTGSVDVTGDFTINGVPFTGGSSGTSGTSGTSGDSLFAQTGSWWNTTNNVGITGSLRISGSQAVDLEVTGGVKVATNDGKGFSSVNPSNFNVDTTLVSTLNAENYVFGSTGSVSSLYVGVYDQPSFNTDVEFKLSVNTGSGIQFSDWDNVSAGAYVPWLSVAPNLGNNPAPQFKRSVGITGSLNVSSSLDHNIRGNVIMTGSLNISGSADSDLNLYGRALISGPTSGNTPRLLVSNSLSNSRLIPENIYTQNAAGDGGQLGSVAGGYVVAYKNDGTELALSADAAQYGSGWSGPAIIINDAGDNYPAMIGFQTKSGYTNGTISLLKNTAVTGSLTVTGSIISTGSITIQSGSGDLYMYGHKMFSIGQFQNNTTLSGSANVSQSMVFDVTDYSEGVSLVSGSRLTVANAGYYNIQFSAQIKQTGGGTANAHIWFKKNGSNIVESATRYTLPNNTYQVAALNFGAALAANDYVEIAWQSDDASTQLLYEAPTGNIPAVPSVIASVTQIR